MVAVGHVSNALGTINPVRQIIEMAHRAGALALIDGAQAAPHLKIDVQALDADFYTFSGHKVIGPTGIGILYGKARLLNAMPPYQGGGDMIKSVTFEKTIYADLPYKFEAGTPNIAGGIGLGAAFDYVTRIGLDTSPLTSMSCWSTAPRRCRAFPASASSARRERKRPCFRSSSKAFILTISAPCSTGRGLPCAPATIARSR